MREKQLYAVAVREDDGTLYLVHRIHRSQKGEIFRMWAGRGNRDPPTSYHSNGRMHQKSYDHKHLVWKKQKPGEHLKGCEPMADTPLASDEHLAINEVCDPAKFSEVMEIPVAEIAPEHAYLSIAVCEPGVEPILPKGAFIRCRRVFKDRAPWILVTLYDYPHHESV